MFCNNNNTIVTSIDFLQNLHCCFKFIAIVVLEVISSHVISLHSAILACNKFWEFWEKPIGKLEHCVINKLCMVFLKFLTVFFITIIGPSYNSRCRHDSGSCSQSHGTARSNLTVGYNSIGCTRRKEATRGTQKHFFAVCRTGTLPNHEQLARHWMTDRHVDKVTQNSPDKSHAARFPMLLGVWISRYWDYLSVQQGAVFVPALLAAAGHTLW